MLRSVVIAGKNNTMWVDPRDVRHLLSAENGLTQASDFRGTIQPAAVESNSTVPRTSEAVAFSFNADTTKYEAIVAEAEAATYFVSVSMANGSFWIPISSSSGGSFIVTQDVAVPEYSVFQSGCSHRCRTMPNVTNSFVLGLRDRFNNSRTPDSLPVDEVTTSIVGFGVESAPPVWRVDGYYTFFSFDSVVDFDYSVDIFVNLQTWPAGGRVDYEYFFHTNLNASRCFALSCHEFYGVARFNGSGWDHEQACRTAGCLYKAATSNVVSVTMADPMPSNAAIVLVVTGLCPVLARDFHSCNDSQSLFQEFCMDAQTSGITVDDAIAVSSTTLDIHFQVPHPGEYNLTVTFTDQYGGEHALAPVHVLVGPGDPDLSRSVVRQLTSTNDMAAGKNVAFEVEIVDADDDPRYGHDVRSFLCLSLRFHGADCVNFLCLSFADEAVQSQEIVVEIKRLPKGDVRLGTSGEQQPSASETFELMTPRSKIWANSSADTGLVSYGSDCGLYRVEAHLPVAAYGVFEIHVWVCPAGLPSACVMKNSSFLLSTHVDVKTGNPGNPGPLVFTACQANASTSDPGVQGSSLDSCLCEAGYTRIAGAFTCAACEGGKYKQEAGPASCKQCAAGSHCNCLVEHSRLGRLDGDTCKQPACTQCAACLPGFYQNKIAQRACNSCPAIPGNDGFSCPEPGMTYPLARPGFWVSPKDPTKFRACSGRPQACPGSKYLQNSSVFDPAALPEDEKKYSICYLRNAAHPTNLRASGFAASGLPHAGFELRWTESTPISTTVECWDVVGAKCATGYSDAGGTQP